MYLLLVLVPQRLTVSVIESVSMRFTLHDRK